MQMKKPILPIYNEMMKELTVNFAYVKVKQYSFSRWFVDAICTFPHLQLHRGDAHSHRNMFPSGGLSGKTSRNLVATSRENKTASNTTDYNESSWTWHQSFQLTEPVVRGHRHVAKIQVSWHLDVIDIDTGEIHKAMKAHKSLSALSSLKELFQQIITGKVSLLSSCFAMPFNISPSSSY